MNAPGDGDPIGTGTVLGWAGTVISSLLAVIMGLFSRTIRDHEDRLRKMSSEVADAQSTADRALTLFTTSVETANLYQRQTVAEIKAIVELNAAKTQASLDLHTVNTERKLDAIHARLDLAGIVRTRPTRLPPDDGA